MCGAHGSRLAPPLLALPRCYAHPAVKRASPRPLQCVATIPARPIWATGHAVGHGGPVPRYRRLPDRGRGDFHLSLRAFFGYPARDITIAIQATATIVLCRMPVDREGLSGTLQNQRFRGIEDQKTLGGRGERGGGGDISAPIRVV